METSTRSSADGAGAAFARLLQHLAALLETRVELTRREVRGALRGATLAAAALLAALVLLLLLIPVVAATAILLLSQIIPAWQAAGAVLLAMALVAAGLIVFARVMLRRRRLTLLRGLQEDWEAVRRAWEQRP